MNIACHVKQSSKTISSGGTLSWRWHGGKGSVRVVPTATTRILRHRFPGASETVGQVFKFVWRLHWKINVVCMSLSPFVSFKSRFVTYLLNFPRTYHHILPLRVVGLHGLVAELWLNAVVYPPMSFWPMSTRSKGLALSYRLQTQVLHETDWNRSCFLSQRKGLKGESYWRSKDCGKRWSSLDFAGSTTQIEIDVRMHPLKLLVL